mgnify:FL=1
MGSLRSDPGSACRVAPCARPRGSFALESPPARHIGRYVILFNMFNVNVLFSHPTELYPQKDGRKVRSRDEGTLKFRRVADRRSDAAPAVGLSSTLRASEIPRSHLFSTVQRRLDPESLNLEREDSLMTRRSLRTQRLRSTGGVSRLLVRGVIWSDCIGRRREPLPPAVRGGVVCWSWGSFVAFFLVVGLQLVGLGFVG